MKKQIVLASTLALTLLASARAQANVVSQPWIPRSVEEIRADISSDQEGKTYTIQYGDTLFSIAYAMEIDMNLLAQVNQISNLNLIFPDTTLKTKYDQNHALVEIEIEQSDTSAVVDLQNKQVVVENEVVAIPEAPAPEVPATEAPTTESPVTEAPATETLVTEVPTSEIPVIEEAVTEIPITETPATSVSATEVPTSAPTQAAVPTTTVNTSGLQPKAAAFMNEIASIYGITSFSTFRPGDPQDHGKGLAVDFMVPISSALGDQIADYTAANMASRGVSYIIWKQRFYAPFNSIYGPAYTWNLMPDRGSITENHYDHVHVSFNP
jgi:hypothetical protein